MSNLEENIQTHSYWLEKYKIDSTNSNFYDDGPTRGFHDELIESKLGLHEASRAILEMADYFAEQMWHDLAKQKHLHLNYWINSHGSDKFFPEFGVVEKSQIKIIDLDDEVLKQICPGQDVTWIARSSSFDRSYARDRAQELEGQEHFLENDYVYQIDEEPFPYMNLGLAIGAGKEYGDIDLVNDEVYDFYLEQIFGGDIDMLETEVEITSDTPWVGIRYRELTEDQQMNLAINLLTSMEHPYLGKPDGISRHFLCCLALHDSTAENVKTFLSLQLAD